LRSSARRGGSEDVVDGSVVGLRGELGEEVVVPAVVECAERTSIDDLAGGLHIDWGPVEFAVPVVVVAVGPVEDESAEVRDIGV
jgi:hypothetical protein